jgi:hypothetical protein
MNRTNRHRVIETHLPYIYLTTYHEITSIASELHNTYNIN